MRPASPVDPADRRNYVQSVGRAFDVLAVLERSESPLSVVEVARACGYDRSVVQRLLRTMGARHMVIEQDGRFAVGPRGMVLANKYLDELPLRRIALPLLVDFDAQVVKDRPWATMLILRVGAVTTMVDRISSSAVPLSVLVSMGATFPLHRTAAGRCILAFLPETEATELIGTTRYSDLEPRFADIRRSGGVDVNDIDLESVSVVVQDRCAAPVAALGVAGIHLGDQLSRDSALASELRTRAAAITTHLG